jgi:hypothetical protein
VRTLIGETRGHSAPARRLSGIVSDSSSRTQSPCGAAVSSVPLSGHS